MVSDTSEIEEHAQVGVGQACANEQHRVCSEIVRKFGTGPVIGARDQAVILILGQNNGLTPESTAPRDEAMRMHDTQTGR